MTSNKGKVASPKDLKELGFGKEGIEKDSTAADMMSQADKTDHGKKVVSELQRAGAKGEDFDESSLNREELDDAGLKRRGVEGGSLAAETQSAVDKSGAGEKVKQKLQQAGATTQ